ncbi:hydrocephalus-inducing protein homolog isoform X2 [Sycon ciliatum]|uniref:hydrocephalus-inducing protein homolog isoform X2 n=1 Tax=Sycon ciliatum TaxID=27933 RepID=UPI0031F625D8
MSADTGSARSGEQLHGELLRRWSEAKAAEKPSPSEFEKLISDKEKGLIDVEPSRSSFAAVPPVVCFHGSTDSVLLTLNNRSKAAHTVRLKANHTAAPWLQVTGKKKLGERIAQGMEAVISLHCTALGKSASTILTFSTDEGDLTIPVLVVGPRSRLHIPDKVDLGIAVCKHASAKTVTVKNSGSATALFAMHADRPFGISPGYLSIPPGEHAEVEVSFSPTKMGKHAGELVIMFEHGELTSVDLQGKCTEIEARLDSSDLQLAENAIGMIGSKVLTFRNWTSHALDFKWCRYAMPEVDDAMGAVDTVVDSEAIIDALISGHSDQDQDGNGAAHGNDRPLAAGHPTQSVESSNLFGSNPQQDVIRIDPAMGTIPPKSLFDFTVIFSPTVAKLHTDTAYLQVDGFQDRIPLTISGLATGAQLTASTQDMDLGHIMVHERNNFEIQLTNTSLVAGDFKVELPDTEMAKDIAITPDSGAIQPGGMSILQISLVASRITDFDETFVILVDNSDCQVHVRLRAVVVGPLLHFNPESLVFDDVGYGFPTQANATLINTSTQDIRITLTIRYEDDDGDSAVPRFDLEKVEKAPLGACDSCTFWVRSLAESPGDHTAVLVVEVEGIEQILASMPIAGKCIIPQLSVPRRLVDLRENFVDLWSEADIQVHNEEWLPLNFSVEIPVKESSDSGALECDITGSRPLKPGESATLHIRAKALALGSHSLLMKIGVVGSEIMEDVEVRFSGLGPVVSLSVPTNLEMEWGKIPVLKESQKSFSLRNESGIPATVTLESNAREFTLSTNRVKMVPGGSADVVITAFVKESKKFVGVVSLHVDRGAQYRYALSAIGYGSTLHLKPVLPFLTPLLASMVTMKPVARFKSGEKAVSIDIDAELKAGLNVYYLDLKRQYSRVPIARQLTIANDGLRVHECSFSTWGYSPSRVHHMRMVQQEAAELGKTSAPITEAMTPSFSITPDSFVLRPGDEVTVTVKGFSKSVRFVQERLLMHTVCGQNVYKEKAMSIDVACKFVEPMLNICPDEMAFRQIVAPGDAVQMQEHPLRLCNVTELPIECTIAAHYPFGFRLPHSERPCEEAAMRIPAHTEATILVQFDPAYQADLFSRKIAQPLSVIYKDHVEVDTVPLHGAVFFPNIALSKLEIDFGHVQWHTRKTESLFMRNIGKVPVAYRWELHWANDADEDEGVVMEEDTSSESSDTDDGDAEGASIPDPLPLSVVASSRQSKHATVSQTSADSQQDQPVPSSEENAERSGVSRSRHSTAKNGVAGGESRGESRQSFRVDTPHGDLFVSQPALDSRASPRSRRHSVQKRFKPFSQLPKVPPSAGDLFDVMPVFGTIHPGNEQMISFDFAGKTGACKDCKAVCRVDGGPIYTVKLSGVASKVKYSLSTKYMDVGSILFNVVHTEDFFITNLGKGPFTFSVYPAEPCESLSRCDVVPEKGKVAPGSRFKLQLKIFAGLPDVGYSDFGIRVQGHRREQVRVKWNGQLASLSLTVPRVVSDGYIRLARVAQQSLKQRGLDISSEYMIEVLEELRRVGSEPHRSDALSTAHMDTAVTSMADVLSSTASLKPPPEDIEDTAKLQVVQMQIDAEIDRVWTAEYHVRRYLDTNTVLKSLPEHGIHFGQVNVSKPFTTCFKAVNASPWPVAFHLDQRQLECTGFYLTTNRLREVRGMAFLDVDVHYDPHRRLGKNSKAPRLSQDELERALCKMCGNIAAYVIFEVPDQPSLALRLQADLYLPTLDISKRDVQFATTKAGECSVQILTLANLASAPLRWHVEMEKPKKPKLDKFMPLHLRKQAMAESLPKSAFSTHPVEGEIDTRDTQQLSVIFTPLEEKQYKESFKIVVEGLANTYEVQVSGRGLEPRLIFPAGTREIGPTLPDDTASSEITVQNPCDFPVEFFATQFDTQFGIEQKILTWDNTFDRQHKMIVPPIEAGSGLPIELLEEYRDTLKMIQDQKQQIAEELQADASAMDVSSTVALAESATSIGRGKSRASNKGSAREQKEKEKEKEKKKEKKETKKEKEAREAAEAEAAEALRIAELEAARELAMSPMSRIQRSISNLGADITAGLPADFRRMSPQHFTQLLMDPQLGLQDNMPPSVRAICRSLGIDASTNGRQERRSQGIIIVVHGAPSSGKTTHAERLAEKYHVKSLTLDEVLQEAIDGLDDHGGAKASEYLIRARTQILVAHQRELEAAQQQAAANAAGKKGGKPGMSKKLSTSTLSGSGGNAHAPISPLASGKAQGVSSDAAGATPLSASTLTSPPAHTAHSAFPLDESIDPLLVERASTSRDDITVPLDEDIAVEILRHRLMRDEHYLGAIFDGLQTTILSDMDAAYRVIRRAVGNRRHFYFFDLYCDRSGLDQRDRRRPFFEYTEFDRPETPVVVELPDWRTIAEEDYLNLDEDTRRRVDEQQAMDKKQERLRKRQEKEEEERRIREAQEAEERRLEEEKNLKKKKKMSKHQLVGQSPSGSVANLVRRGSRPSSGAHQRSNSLLVPPDAAAAGLESKTSIGDAGELGKSKLAGASRSRFDSTMTLDKIADEATVVEDEVESARCPAADTPPFPADFDGELPGFPEYYASRATLPRVMGLWHPDDGGFVPDPEKPSPVEQAPPAGGTGKKGLGRVKETDSRADVAKPDSMAPAAAATQDKAEQDFEFPTYVSIDVQLPRPPQATEAPDGTDSRLFDYPYSVIEGLDELPVPSSARSTESDASSTANTDSLHSRIPKTSAIVLPMQCRQPSSVSREEQAEVDESAMHQLAKKLRVSIDQLYWPGKGELPARQTSLQSAHSMASTHSSGSTQHEGKTGREEDEQQHEQVEHGEQGQRRRSSGQQRPSTCSIESQAEPMMDMLYTTIAEDIGQSAELVAQYLDSLTPSLEEVIADIPFGPGNPTELPQATFQLVQHPGLDVEEMETENLACFSLMAEPAPPPPPEPVMEPFGGGQSAGSKEADSHATSEGTKKPGSSRSQKGSATSLGKKSGSGRKSVAKSPQPPKRSGRASAASEDSISSRPSTASLDQMSMASAEQKPPPVRPVHRWVVPPRGSVSFHVHFLRKVQSTVDKVLKFEIVGSRRRYDLFCRGISRYPDMNRLPQIIWPNMISRMPRGGAKPQRVFVTESKTYFFGSLLSGKPHDRMLEGRFPENMVKVKVINTTGLPITVDPSFERDDSGETFFVEPRNMVLPPAGKGALTISAFPRMKQDSVYVEDVLRIAFNQNPEPLIFGVTCWSSKPHLVAEPNEFPFSRVAMGRSVTKEVKIYNKSMLPVAFHVTGIKELGDEFTLDNDHGVIAPGDSATVKLTVKSLRAFALKKSLRLEVFDQDHTMGMVHSENLAVNCEVYDVLVDINYPKSPSGSEDSELEFAACRVYEEQKLTMHLRNKGKYTVNYQYHVDKKSLPDLGLTDAFCIIPQKGMLQPGEKPTAVAITFLPEVQVEMLRTPVIHLEILDPFCGGEQDESIAYVPCRVTCKAVFSRYNVQPAADLNFGTMIMQTRRERKFTLINSGEFEFKYQLMRYDGLVTPLATASHAKRLHAIENTQEKNKRAKEALARAAQAKKDFNSRPEGMSGQGSNSRLLIGPFTCSPAMGSVAPGNQAIITVECHADSNARTDVLALDIADRAPEDNPNGFPYNLIMEACVPSVDTGLRDIFEEHNIVPSAAHISAPQMQRVYVGQGTLCEDERQFLFHSVFVGTQVKARLKLVNKTKLPCDINITIKGQNAKASMKLSDVFSVQPNKFSLDGKDMKLVTITFCPQAIQTYNCTFDIGVVDPAVLTSSVMSRGPKSQCQFDVCGEGALPRLSLLEPPAVVNTKNSVAEIEQTPLEFRRLLPHRCSVKMVVVKNHSPFSCEVEVRLVEHLDDARLVAFSFADGVDACTDVPDPAATDMPMVEPKQRRVKVPARLAARNATPFQSTSLQDALAGAATESDTPRKRSTMTLHVGAEETVRIAIKCAPKIVGSCQGELQVAAAGNPFEVARVKLLGEGYTDTLQVLGLEEVMSCFKMLKSTSIEKVDSTTRVAVDKKETKKQQQQNLRSESRVSTCPEEAVRCWHVDFGGTEVKAKKSLHFTITNHDANSVLKFKFIMPALDAKTTLTCVPSFGHIGPGRTKTIHASIVAKKPISVERLCFSCKTVRINYVSQGEVDVQTLDAEDWDEQSVVAQIVEAVPTHKIGAFEMPDHLVRPIRQLQEEPEHTAVDRSARDLAFAVSMECEYATYECPMANAVDDAMPTVEFKSTAFYQARDLLLPLTNTSKVDMRYKWAINDETDVGSTPSLPPLSAAPTDLFDALLLPLKRRHQLPAFFIEPSEGTVAAGGTVTFKVTFRPVVPDKSTIKLTCSIPNLSPTLDPPAMTLVGNGIVPIAHLDLPPSDYLTGARRAVELKTEPEHTLPTGAQLHVNTKVMEFTSHAQQPTARDFRVANPTSRPWKYVWEMNPITPRDAENAFKITTVEGVIDAGKRNKMVIEFAPSNTRFLEGFWNFTIPEHRLSIPFLLVGRMTDPDVTLSTIALNFGSTLTGRKVKRSLEIINTEEVFVEYSFSDPSRKVDLHTANVSVSPRQGKVPPRSRKTIDVEMSLFVEKEISFSISCKVKGMLKTLPLNIKAEGYTVHVEGTMESPATDGKTITKQLDLAPNFNIVDFGKVQVNEKVVRTISVYNNGRFPTVYQWAVTQACDDPGGCAPSDVHSGKGRRKLISLKPNLKGSIEPAASQKFTIVFCPSQKKVLSGCEAVCQMAYGPSFRVVFAGEGTKPSLHFSFTKHNFGACFAGRPAETGQKKTLTIKNDHSQPVSIKCLPFKTDHLSVAFKAGIMPPGASKEALFQFHPRTVGKVQEVVQFDVNGLSTTNVRFAGEGTALKVEVADPEQSFIKLKTIQPRQTCSRTVKLVNRSLAPITFDVGLSPRATLDASVLTVKPHSDIQLGPGAACNVVVTFSPTGRMPRFSEEIIMEYANAVMPLFTVSAACIAREVSLDFRRLTFGEVVLGSSTQRRITMKNSGDLSTQYQWDAGKFGPDFAISPMDGVIEAGMEVHFTVSFKPVRLSKDIRYENLLCRLENAAALQLTLTGVCIARTTTREPIQFSCHVRSKDVKTIQIKNPTNQAWVLRPVIEGHYWSGAESVTVDPLSTKPYEVTYKPVVMTADGRKHQGNAFIALPDGNAIYYTFLGSAQEAKVVTVPSREWPCKKELNEEFTISNWLKTPQRFNVKIDIIKPDKNDPATNIHGLDYVDVPAGGKAGYQLRFRAHREGTTSMRLTFRNPDTREHLVYLFAVKSTSPEMIKTITLRTPVRQGIPHTIVVHNPLESPVVFSAVISCNEISLPQQFTVPGKSDGECTLQYLPLKVGRSSTKLTFSSHELGSYGYELAMEASLPPPEQSLFFRTTLGDKQVQTCHFTNFARTKTEYLCKVDDSNFLVERSISALAAVPGGTALSTEVTFEPQWLGDFKGTLTIASSSGGEYQFPVKGTCLQPKPQGPMVVKGHATTTIPFKNVFAKPAKFHFSIDNPAFTLRSTSDTLRARKVYYIGVSCETGHTTGSSKAAASQPPPPPPTGTLTVSCTAESLKEAGLPCSETIQWVFYVRGVP